MNFHDDDDDDDSIDSCPDADAIEKHQNYALRSLLGYGGSSSHRSDIAVQSTNTATFGDSFQVNDSYPNNPSLKRRTCQKVLGGEF